MFAKISIGSNSGLLAKGMIGFSILFCLVFNAVAQDYDAWKNAVNLEYQEGPAVIRYKNIDISFFRKKRNPGQPGAIVRYSYKIAPTGSVQSLPFTILLDSHSKVVNIRTEGRRMKPGRLQTSDYADGNLLHSDVSLAEFDLQFGKRLRERRVIYTVELDDIRYLAPLYLHDRYAVFESNIHVHVPQWLNLDIVEYHMEDSIKFKRDVLVNSKEIKDYHLKSYSFEPGFIDPNQPPPSYIYPHLFFVPKTYQSKKEVDYPLFRNLLDLYSWYKYILLNSDNEVFAINKYLENVLQSDKNDREKMEAVFYWVQDNIRYLAFEQGAAGYQPQPAKEVYENRYGDCKGMANLTRNLLNRAGLDARLAWLGSNYLIYDYTHPTVAVDNHMICAVRSGESWIFLDTTEPYVPAGSYSDNISGRPVLIEDGEKYYLEKIPELDAGLDVARIEGSMELAHGENLQGVLEVNCSGAAKYALMTSIYSNNDKADALNAFLDLNEHHEIAYPSADWNMWKSRDSTISLTAEFSARNAGSVFGEEIYIDLASLGIPVPAAIPVRMRHAYMPSPTWRIEMQYRIELPEGYRLKYVPEPLMINSRPVDIQLEMAEIDGQVELHYHVSCNSMHIEIDEFEAWNDARNQLITYLKDQVIIEK